MRKAIDFFLERGLVVNLFTLILLVIGTVVVYNLQKELFPRVDFGVINIVSVYPGSSAKDVEKSVSIPIERALKGVSGIKRLHALSFDTVSRIVIEVEQDAKVKDVYSDVKNAVDSVTDLPDEVDPPTVKDMNNKDQQTLSIVLTGDDYLLIRDVAEKLRDRIEFIKEVRRVSYQGHMKDQIRIEISPEKLRRYEVTAEDITKAVRERNVGIPGGRIETKEGHLFVRTVAEFKTAYDIKNVVIRSNASGENIKIADVAKVTQRPEDHSTRVRADGKKAIILNTVIKSNADIITSNRKIKQHIQEFFETRPQYKDKVNYDYIGDASYWVKRRLSALTDNGIMGLILVFICLVFFLNRNASIVTTLSAPIAFMIAFVAMSNLGITLNLISMFSLIMVLGMLVDDSIIVAEYYFQKLEEGSPPKEAARQAAYETIKPVAATVFTTMTAFAAFFFMGGTMGKFTRAIPIIVIICLAASLIECYFILPSHLSDFVRLGNKKGFREKLYGKMVDFYRCFLNKTLRFHWGIVLFFVFLFGGSIYIATTMKLKLFPGDDVREVLIQIKGPLGKSLDDTDKIAVQIEKIIMNNVFPDELEMLKTRTGIFVEERRQKTGTHYASLLLFLTPPNDRKRSTDEILAEITKKLKPVIKDYSLAVTKRKGGPPSGRDVDIELTGDSLEELSLVAKKVQRELKKIDGVLTTETDFEEGKQQLAVTVKEDEAKRLGVTALKIANEIRHIFSNDAFDYIREEGKDYDTDIVLFLDEKSKSRVETLDSLYVANKQKRRIPLSKLIEIEKKPIPFVIRRKNRKRIVSVTADIDSRKTGSVEIARKFSPTLDNILKNHPNVDRYFGGENENTKESMENLFKALAISFSCIFVILVLALGSLRHSIVVMSAIPLGFIGVILVFKIAGKALSFMSLLGVVALVGIVVNDSIILVNFINKIRQKEKDIYKAVIKAAGDRYRPVILTTFTTVSGLLFLAHPILAKIVSFGANRDFDPFLQPMAMSIAWGLFFASTITLVFIPAFYIVMERCYDFTALKLRTLFHE